MAWGGGGGGGGWWGGPSEPLRRRWRTHACPECRTSSSWAWSGRLRRSDRTGTNPEPPCQTRCDMPTAVAATPAISEDALGRIGDAIRSALYRGTYDFIEQ